MSDCDKAPNSVIEKVDGADSTLVNCEKLTANNELAEPKEICSGQACNDVKPSAISPTLEDESMDPDINDAQENSVENNNLDIADRLESPVKSIAVRPESPAKIIADRPESPVKSIADRPESPAKSIADRPESPAKSIADRPESPAKSIADRPESPAKSIADRPESPVKSIADRPESPAKSIADRSDDLIKSVVTTNSSGNDSSALTALLNQKAVDNGDESNRLENVGKMHSSTFDRSSKAEDDHDMPAASKKEACASFSKEGTLCVYRVKRIQFNGKDVGIITQNENGPCPLLAIMNVLILRGQIVIPLSTRELTSDTIMEYLGDCLFKQAPLSITEDNRLNYEQNINDAVAVFHKLQTGLDVNVKFNRVNSFEYTQECIVFDLLAIPLYHGWLVDPQNADILAAVGSCSYNQLVEKIIQQKSDAKHELVTEALIAEEFLASSASQLTYHGLSELCCTIKENQLAVFFRNNHFSTLYCKGAELFVLVTDQGFLNESQAVWETLHNVEGDGQFVNADFQTYTKPQVSDTDVPSFYRQLSADQQVSQDYLLAVSLQEETNNLPQQKPVELSDHDLALRLHEEEQKYQSQPMRSSLPLTNGLPEAAGSKRGKKKSDCVIL